jgi:hypothetical protein
MPYGAIIQAVMQIAGAAVAGNQLQKARGGYEAQMGKTKKVEPIREPNPQMFNYGDALNSIIGINKNNRTARYDDAAQQNKFNRGQAMKMYTAFQPYFKQLQEQQGANALSFSRGELPQDTVDSIGRAAASRGIQGGYGMGASAGSPGSAMSKVNLRDLGLTSLDLTKYGTGLSMDVNRLAQQLSPGLANPEAYALSPQLGMGYAEGNTNRLNESNRYWNSLENKAEWDNVATLNYANEAIANANLASRSAEAKMWSELGSSSGSAMGGMGGGGGGGGGSSMMSMFGGV